MGEPHPEHLGDDLADLVGPLLKSVYDVSLAVVQEAQSPTVAATAYAELAQLISSRIDHCCECFVEQATPTGCPVPGLVEALK